MTTYQELVGQMLRATRMGYGLSLHDVEVRAGGLVSACKLGTWERADRGVTVEQIAGLARFYRVPLTELLPDVAP